MKGLWFALALLLFTGMARAQSVEAYAGQQRAGVDLMWFKQFKKDSIATPFLFFSRNRANCGYDSSAVAFGSTNAVSYNFENGLGLVAVASFTNIGFVPKFGVQYYRQKGDFMFFGWFVADISKNPNFDLFGLFRYQPSLGKQLKLFAQLELFPVYRIKNQSWNLTERLRLGIKRRSWAVGFMTDFNQSGKDSFVFTQNFGGFLRKDF